MSLPDPIERAESRAERQFDDMYVGDGKMRCGCGNVFNMEDGEALSPDPWAMPVCSECAQKYYDEHGIL